MDEIHPVNHLQELGVRHLFARPQAFKQHRCQMQIIRELRRHTLIQPDQLGVVLGEWLQAEDRTALAWRVPTFAVILGLAWAAIQPRKIFLRLEPLDQFPRSASFALSSSMLAAPAMV